jgi:hypothetical protein
MNQDQLEKWTIGPTFYEGLNGPFICQTATIRYKLADNWEVYIVPKKKKKISRAPPPLKIFSPSFFSRSRQGKFFFSSPLSTQKVRLFQRNRLIPKIFPFFLFSFSFRAGARWRSGPPFSINFSLSPDIKMGKRLKLILKGDILIWVFF